jgi:hypothetical protein
MTGDVLRTQRNVDLRAFQASGPILDLGSAWSYGSSPGVRTTWSEVQSLVGTEGGTKAGAAECRHRSADVRCFCLTELVFRRARLCAPLAQLPSLRQPSVSWPSNASPNDMELL